MRYACIAGCFALLIMLGSACQSSTAPFDIELAFVERIDILILESFPVQVHVRAQGVLGDVCTTLDQITQQWEGNLCWVRIMTRRPADAVCAAMVTPFEETIPLEVVGLAAGTYIVDVNGVRGEFTLAVDNLIN